MAPQLVRNVRNQRQGAVFEAAFEWEAKRADLLPLRNGQAVRYLPGGKIIAVRSNLDWTVLGREGLVCFADTKSFAGTGFTYSQLEQHQLQRALAYQARGFLAGFCVHLRESDAVCFYSGQLVQGRGPRSRFEAQHGTVLGTLRRFDVRAIWRQ